MAKAGENYELLTKQIFETALTQDQVKNLQVLHNTSIAGRSTRHQIDVYWEFESAGLPYRTIVQCKDWHSAVDQAAMLTFAAVLDDIPGQPRGIFIARSGYQAGARDVAAQRGIVLYTLRTPTALDFTNRIRHVTINATPFIPAVSPPIFEWDREWYADELRRRDLPSDTTLNITVTGRPDELYLYDASGIRRCSLHDVARSLLPEPGVELPTSRLTKVFDEPAYFPINGVEGWARLKVRAIAYDISVVQGSTITTISSVDDVIAYLLEDTLSGTTKLIDRELRMRS